MTKPTKHNNPVVKRETIKTGLSPWLLSIAEAVDRYGFNGTTLRRWVREGKVPAIKQGSFWFIRETDCIYLVNPVTRKKHFGILEMPKQLRMARPKGWQTTLAAQPKPTKEEQEEQEAKNLQERIAAIGIEG